LLQSITKYLQKQTESDTKEEQTALFTSTAFYSPYLHHIIFLLRIAWWN